MMETAVSSVAGGLFFICWSRRRLGQPRQLVVIVDGDAVVSASNLGFPGTLGAWGREGSPGSDGDGRCCGGPSGRWTTASVLGQQLVAGVNGISLGVGWERLCSFWDCLAG